MAIPAEPSTRSGIPIERILEQLACPVCFGPLQPDATSAQIQCADCSRSYPLINGIPVLIAERATATKDS